MLPETLKLAETITKNSEQLTNALIKSGLSPDVARQFASKVTGQVCYNIGYPKSVLRAFVEFTDNEWKQEGLRSSLLPKALDHFTELMGW